jgi:hypothetical protein
LIFFKFFVLYQYGIYKEQAKAKVTQNDRKPRDIEY